MASAARALGLGVMLGCMIESGLGIAAGATSRRSATTSTSTATSCCARTRGRASASRTASSFPRTRPGLGVRARRYLILAEGYCGRPALREDRAGDPRTTRRDPTVAMLDSTRAGETMEACRSSARSTEALPLRADDGGRRRRHAGRALSACVARAARGVHRGRPRRRERAARVHRRRPGAVGARAQARRRAARPAPATRGPQRPDRREPRGRRADRPHRRLGLRDREEDGRARARPRGPARAASGRCSVPTGQTGIAIAGWGIAVDAVVSDFLAGAAERIVVEGAERGGTLLFVEGQGSLVHPLYSGVTLGLIHGAAPHAFVLCHKAGTPRSKAARGTRFRRSPSSSSCTSAISLPARKARVAAIALNTAGLDERGARRRRSTRRRTETGLPADDPVRFGPR